jgi:PAS domain S-box-containing protein
MIPDRSIESIYPQSGLSAIIGKMLALQELRSPWRRYGLAVALPSFAFALNWTAFGMERTPYFALFMTTVAFTALFGGRGPGLVNTVISTILGFLVAPPAWTWRLSEREDAIRIALSFILGCLISIVVGVVGELQRTLRCEHSTLAKILYTIGDGVITTNQDGQITFLNDVAKRATGWDRESAIGRSVDEVARITIEHSRTVVAHPVRLALESSTAVDRVIDGLLVRPDGTEIPITYSAACIDSGPHGIPGGLLVFRDISRLKNSCDALIRTEKLATAGKLAATLAHEVNNPLAATSNLLFLSQTAPDLDSARSYANEAFQQTLRAAYFVRQGLAFAKTSDWRQYVDVERLIDGVLSLHSNKIATKNARVLKVCAPGIQVRANRSELEQVISNLVSNALDAIYYQGTIHLRVTRSGGMMNFLIADTGCGISPQHLPRLFDAFFTTKPEVGVGLGLWVTRRIIDSHGGRIRLRSSQGKGTVVKVSLPAIDPVSTIETSRLGVEDSGSSEFVRIPVTSPANV